ncbi:hypothetical protein AX766_07275 [Flavobacterium covae]|uniref:Porin n=2 Tax=Flavobacteriaceae TaxID=49546 RepID=A0AA94F5M3_9FLAO|nr:hypothetical protein AWN65_12690 [Flavobacterium covae]AND64227.1 hypothetical protein AX766_07275 [Flavobacterium covae]MCH4828274.1 porin [Flavobacterium columnare]MCH4834251.1 porin [Flavobacterium columnare]
MIQKNTRSKLIKIYSFLFLFSPISKVFSQNDTVKKMTVSAYGELYYSYDFSKPQNHEKHNFVYSHKRHNELNFNLLLLKLNYKDQNIRANLGLMGGNYATYNLSAEPTWAQFIYEANVGARLSKKQNLWLDVGVLPSHIGFGSAVGGDCWTLTRSLITEGSPYYEAGVRLSYQSPNEKIYLAALYLNGWQRIKKPDFIQKPSFGGQVTFKPNKKMLLNYSNFIGTDKPDSINAVRTFHNVYMQYEPSDKIGIIAGFDIGSDKYDNTNYGTWYGPILMLKTQLNKKMITAFRAEYYNDKNQIIVPTGTPNGFQVLGFSSNLDYELSEKLKFRFEAKAFNAKDRIFNNDNNNYSVTTSLIFRT